MVETDLAARRARHQYTVGGDQEARCMVCGVFWPCDAAVAFAALEAAEAAARVAEQHMAALQAESAHLQAVIRHNWKPRAEQAEAENVRLRAVVRAAQDYIHGKYRVDPLVTLRDAVLAWEAEQQHGGT